jgi:hypothetical protein
MAVTATPVFVQTPKVTPQNYVQGTDVAGTYKTIYTAGANGSKVASISIATDDTTAAHLITFIITRSAVDYVLGIANVTTAGEGTQSSTVAVDGMAGMILPVDNDGQKYLFLVSGDTLRATFATALTAAKRIDITAIGADF